MKKGFVLVCGLIVAVVGCDSEDGAEVGAFTSSLSGEEATVQNLTFTQKDTLCAEVVDYGAAKMQSLEDQYGCLGPVASGADTVETDESDPCAAEDKYLNCEATVAELEGCFEEQALIAYIGTVELASFFSGLGEAGADEAAEASDGEGVEGDAAEALGDAFSALSPSCDLPSAETVVTPECAAIAAKCPDLFLIPGPSELPMDGLTGMEGGEEAPAEEGGEEAAAEEGGEEAAAEEGGEEAPVEEGGEA